MKKINHIFENLKNKNNQNSILMSDYLHLSTPVTSIKIPFLHSLRIYLILQNRHKTKNKNKNKNKNKHKYSIRHNL
jgi:hypothetical protein